MKAICPNKFCSIRWRKISMLRISKASSRSSRRTPSPLIWYTAPSPWTIIKDRTNKRGPFLAKLSRGTLLPTRSKSTTTAKWWSRIYPSLITRSNCLRFKWTKCAMLQPFSRITPIGKSSTNSSTRLSQFVDSKSLRLLRPYLPIKKCKLTSSITLRWRS